MPDETTLELLLQVDRAAAATLGEQVEVALREAIRSRSLAEGARLPSTRDLAEQLGVSRRIVVDAYAQLSAEGWLALRRGARPTVAAVMSEAGPLRHRGDAEADPPAPVARYDLRPSVPDVSSFPRAVWLRCLRTAVTSISDHDLGYGDVRGVLELRTALAEYLGRVRGVVCRPEQVVVTSGYSQALGLVARALAEGGASSIALERPGDREYRQIVARSGLRVVEVEVDADGLQVAALGDVDAVCVAPAHHSATGAVLAPPRRRALVDWLVARDAVALEDDYDAEYRYDRAAVGALQGLAPDRVAYAGTASKTLAPALRLGWLVVPPSLLDAVVLEKTLADRGSARIEQLAFADFLRRGELDRHLRRMRTSYRERRAALVAALAAVLPGAEVIGIPAGLQLAVRVDADLTALQKAATRRRLALNTIDGAPGTLVLGYGRLPVASARPAVRALAAALEESR